MVSKPVVAPPATFWRASGSFDTVTLALIVTSGYFPPMRLLAVRLQNLNSLSGTHEVRFDMEPLSAAGVFLITGPTGAGKSTLLDAMTPS